MNAKLTAGAIKEDRHRDVFWQKSFVEDDQMKIPYKIVICASQEFLAMKMKRRMKDVQIDAEIENWFQGQTKQIHQNELKIQRFKDGETIYCLYPDSNAMRVFADTL